MYESHQFVKLEASRAIVLDSLISSSVMENMMGELRKDQEFA